MQCLKDLTNKISNEANIYSFCYRRWGGFMDEQKLILTHAWKVFQSQPVPKQQKHRKW